MLEFELYVGAVDDVRLPSDASRCAGGWTRIAPSPQAFDGDAEGVRVVGYGRLRVRDAGVSTRVDDPVATLARLWRAHGDGMLDHLGGEFTFALLDGMTGRTIAAVDHFNTFPMYFGAHGGALAVGTRPMAVARALGLESVLDAGAVLSYLYFHVIPAPLSIVRGVRRLDVGERAVSDGPSFQVARYWRPAFDERAPFDFERARTGFLDGIRTGVAESVEGLPESAVGCFLSGGTDSSTIAGMLTRVHERPARTFSIVFDVGQYDESHYSRLASRHFGTDHTEYALQPADAERALGVIASRYEQPFGNSSAVPTLVCAELAGSKGVERLLGGDGGDELYGGNERYATQSLFALYGKVPAPARAVLESILFGPLRGSDITLFRRARGYVEQANMPLPDRLYAKHNLLERFGRAEVLTAAVLNGARDDEPLDLARDVWARAGDVTQINRLLAYDFKFTLGDNDLPKVARMCHAAGVQVAFPLLADSLVEHSLRLPPDQKLRGRELRHFFRKALRGFLPDEIIDKSKHGFGMPFGDWVLSHERLRALAEDALSGLAQRGIVRREFLGTLRAELQRGHAGYYGTMVWILVVLELWLREHMPAARMA